MMSDMPNSPEEAEAAIFAEPDAARAEQAQTTDLKHEIQAMEEELQDLQAEIDGGNTDPALEDYLQTVAHSLAMAHRDLFDLTGSTTINDKQAQDDIIPE